jgi:hypothetical protein
MKRIKIIPRPKPELVPPLLLPLPPTMSVAPNVQSDEKEHARDVEINNLKYDISNLKKELMVLKTHFENFIKQSQQQQSQQQQSQQQQSQQQQSQQQQQLKRGCICDFVEWVDALEITSEDLEKLFNSKDICDWACSFVVDDLKRKSFEHVPICSIKGSKSDILIYISKNWTKLTDEELSVQFVNKIFKKLLRAFTDWKNENYKLIMMNDKVGSVYHTNNARILSFNENATKLKLKLFNALNNVN